MENDEALRIQRTSEIIEAMEKSKEVQRIQYDYFKHLTTLNIGSIGVAVALFAKLESPPKCLALLIISLLCFFSGIIIALWGMKAAGNAILYVCGIRILWASTKKNTQETMSKVEEMRDNFDAMLDRIHHYDQVTKIALIQGILLFVIFIFAK